MTDIVDAETRSRMMAGIKSRNTRPEVLIRSLLHRAGFRFRLHAPDLPGRPDIVLPKYHAVILVHGCFWHAHDCSLFRLPASRSDFWEKKLEANRARDARNIAELSGKGWRVLVVWECALKGGGRMSDERVTQMLVDWLRSDVGFRELRELPSSGIR
ncbi:MAG: very short patch repair endonuclease [Pseudomonadota bacterium]